MSQDDVSEKDKSSSNNGNHANHGDNSGAAVEISAQPNGRYDDTGAGCYDNPGYDPGSQLDVYTPQKPGADGSQDTEVDPDDDLPCAWGPLTSRCCDRLRSVKLMLFCLCVAGAIQGLLVNGFVSVVISTLERRFDLASTQTGTIASAYDIASVICLIPVSYFGGLGHKPRFLGAGMFIMGVGSFVFSAPHFLTGLYQYESTDDVNQCMLGNNATRGDDPAEVCTTGDSELQRLRYWLIAGQLLHGVGATPLYTLGVTYLDENLKVKLTSLYVGIFYGMTIVGPAVGFLLGGVFLEYYTDIDRLSAAEIPLTVDSPVWVGAWWLGFLLSGSLAVLVAVPLFGFPKHMPGSSVLRSARVSEAYSRGEEAPAGGEGKEEKEGGGTAVRGMLSLLCALRDLLTNPTFMFLCLAGASEGLLLSGFAAFSPKFVESQFSITASWAAMLIGFATIPAGGGGTVLGGYLVKKLNLQCAGIIRMCIAVTVASLLLVLGFLVQCPAQPFAGVNAPYGANSSTGAALTAKNLTGSCNAGCGCSAAAYSPVCGADSVMYFSPCHAGCRHDNALLGNGSSGYHSCACVQDTSAAVTLGVCDSGCGGLLAAFLPIFAFVILFTFMASMPALSATLRCVPEKHKSFALGIQWIIIRCLGTIPAPILFGALIDRSCSLWQSGCEDNQGSCYFYNNASMSVSIMGLALVGKALSVIFFVLSLVLYRAPPPSADDSKQTSGGGDSSDKTATQQTTNGVDKDSNLNVINGSGKNYVADPGSMGHYKHVDDGYM